MKASRVVLHVALGVAHAWLADSDEAGGRRQASLIARAQHALGMEGSDCPFWLSDWSLRLQSLPVPMWARLDVVGLAEALGEQRSLAAACYSCRAWRGPIDADAAPPGFDGVESDYNGNDEYDEGATPARTDLSFPEWVARKHPEVKRWLLRPVRMQAAVTALDGLALPIWADDEQLAQALGICTPDLAWLARPMWRMAPRGQENKRLAASHYRHILLAKARGGFRLLEAPKPQLAAVQRLLLRQLLNIIPVHEAAHGFVAGRSVHTHAAVHAGQAVVCAFDLRDFFHSINAAQVTALWRSLGFPAGVAAQLTALTTVVTPAVVRERLLDEGSITRMQARRLASAHLAQGAPTSPALSNLCSFRLDLRLSALAERFGARYSRYADDMVISGPAHLMRDFAALRGWVGGIALDEGFSLHPDKTRRMPAHTRQRVTGLVVNEKPNLQREDYDLLRAQLHRLSLRQNVPPEEYSVMQGRIAWACQSVTPSRQEKLKALLGRINSAPC